MFELLLSAISTGGLAGASNQYMCLLVLSVAAKLGWVGLVPQVDFVQSWWFIGVVAVFWVLTVLPAYATALGPGVMNVVNTIVNLVSGFVVPASGAVLALSAVGVIADMNPTLYELLMTLRIFDPDGVGIGSIGWAMAGGAGVTAAALTGAKFVAKPSVSSATGTLGTASAPLFATVENTASVLLMVAAYLLSRVNPWLVVVLLGVTIAAIIGVFGWAIYQLWRLGKGIGKLISLIETRPRAGLAVLAEFFIWGSGSLVWELWARGVFRLAMWAAWLATMLVAIPALGAALAAVLAPVPVLELLVGAFVVSVEALTAVVGAYVGIRSAASLMVKIGGGDARPIAAAGVDPIPSV